MPIKQRSKIALFIPSPRIGGGERVMVDLANAFALRGYPVDLLVLNPEGHFAAQIGKNVRIIPLRARRVILSLPKLMQYLRHERPDVLLALNGHTHLLALVARVLTGVQTRIVLRIGNMLSVLYKRYTKLNDRMIPWLSRLLYPRADALIANAKGVARDVVRTCGVSPEKVTVIFNPKNLKRIRAQSEEPVSHRWLGVNKTLPVVIAAGRLREQKGFEALLEAFTCLQTSVPSRLIILGPAGNSTTNRFIAKIAELGITEQVDFAGYVDNPHAYVAKADVFVMPSLWEGLPNALIEALICGTPIVSTDCDSGPREILAPDTDPFMRIQKGIEWAPYGALVPVNGIKEISEAIALLLGDPALREKYRHAERERSVVFDEDTIVDAYLRVLDP